jgi:hemolysin III
MTASSSRAFPWNYSRAEIFADGSVHLVGVICVILGAVGLVTAAVHKGLLSLSAVAIYVATLVFLFGMSAAYNMWPVSAKKWWLRRLDHSAIYLLIAGTYTAFVLRADNNVLLMLLGAIWALALFGVFLKIAYPGRLEGVAIALYLLLGWSGVLVFDQLTAVLSRRTVFLIVVGGVFFTVGVIFHLARRLPFHNAIWHAFVLVAAGFHYSAVFDSLA